MKRTTTFAVRFLIFAGLAFFSGNATAQQEHGHESPHGGQVLTMGDHHVEFLVVAGENDKGIISVYLLDGNLNTVPVDKVEGLVYLTLPDKSKLTLELAATTEMQISEHDEEAEHIEEAEHDNEEMHAEDKEKVSHFQAEVNMKGVDAFDAVVSLKMGEKRNNLRFKYVRGDHEH